MSANVKSVILIGGGSSGGVITITGTSGQITASAPSGAVTLSIPSAMTGINSITSVMGSDFTLGTADTNKNIILTPNGTGQVIGPNGSESKPGYSFKSENSAGMWWHTANSWLMFTNSPGNTWIIAGSNQLCPATDLTGSLGIGSLRPNQIFVGPLGIKIGDGTNGPTITTTGTSPNESLVLTSAGTGLVSITTGLDRTTSANYPICFVKTDSGTQPIYSAGVDLYYNPGSGILTAPSFAGSYSPVNETVSLTSGSQLIFDTSSNIVFTRGTNATSGQFTLSSGAATVSNSAILSGDVILMTVSSVSGTATGVRVTSLSNGVSFTVAGAVTDNGTYNYVIFHTQ